ncbi:MAG TPA: efflux RND transporter periplasmic adaptor subunit [Gammaproteobacteria bacterium]
MKSRSASIFVLLLLASPLLNGCKDQESAAAEAKPVRALPVSVTAVRTEMVEELELSDGRIDSVRAPTLNAEVAGRVVRIHADRGMVVKAGAVLAELDSVDLKLSAQAARADAARLEPMVTNQKNTVKRYQTLRQEGLVSQEMLDNAEAQLATMQQQLNAALNQASLAGRNMKKATITAPFAGQIEERLISEGDFLERGKPLFRLVATDQLQARLPFPETALQRIRPGQPVRLTVAGSEGEPLNSVISFVSPHVDAANNAFYATADLSNPGNWHPGASVNAEVVIETRANALLVPQVSVVRRPAGDVIYVIKGEQVEQRVVETGVTQNGWVEIRKGVAATDKVVVDGANYLTDKAVIKVQEERS